MIAEDDRKAEKRWFEDIEKEGSEMLLLKIEDSSVDADVSWLKNGVNQSFAIKIQ